MNHTFSMKEDTYWVNPFFPTVLKFFLCHFTRLEGKKKSIMSVIVERQHEAKMMVH